MIAVPDTVEKIVGSLFAGFTKVPIGFAGKWHRPKPLQLSATLLRGFSCNHHGCGACCYPVSLEYLPGESRPEGVFGRERQINIAFQVPGGTVVHSVKIIRLKQRGASRCCYLSTTGKCTIHGAHPFMCNFAPLAVRQYKDPTRPNLFLNTAFSRSWNMTKVNGVKGAACEFIPSSVQNERENAENVASHLQALLSWTEHFGLFETYIPEAIEYILKRQLPVTLSPGEVHGLLI